MPIPTKRVIEWLFSLLFLPTLSSQVPLPWRIKKNKNSEKAVRTDGSKCGGFQLQSECQTVFTWFWSICVYLKCSKIHRGDLGIWVTVRFKSISTNVCRNYVYYYIFILLLTKHECSKDWGQYDFLNTYSNTVNTFI